MSLRKNKRLLSLELKLEGLWLCKCILQAEKCISPTHQLTYLGFHAYVESAFEIKIVPITKIEPLTKQEHRWRESKRIPEKII